jgi:hypothetical protein
MNGRVSAHLKVQDNNRINSLLLVAAAGSVLLMSAAEKFWWLAPSVAGFAAILVIWFNWGQHKIRAFRARRPFEAFLTIAPEKGRDSWCHELHVPPNTEIAIQLRIRPRLHYRQLSFAIGFGGIEADRPRPIKVLNTFIKEGLRREQSPADNENHYIDYNNWYHIRDEVERIRPNFYAYGFLVQTKKPGRYPVLVEIITDCGEGKPSKELHLIVEDRLTIRGAAAIAGRKPR